jgi:hypothetical protein
MNINLVWCSKCLASILINDGQSVIRVICVRTPLGYNFGCCNIFCCGCCYGYCNGCFHCEEELLKEEERYYLCLISDILKVHVWSINFMFSLL